ncbi:MAG: hypothetical protein ABI369_11620 [Acetobacteraceae bacterium]
MLENMAGAVGFAMHEERLARAAHNVRLIEATRAATGQRASDRSYRVSLVRALVALAAPVAPTATQSNPGTPALT